MIHLLVMTNSILMRSKIENKIFKATKELLEVKRKESLRFHSSKVAYLLSILKKESINIITPKILRTLMLLAEMPR